MPCYKPLQAWMRRGSSSGKSIISFGRDHINFYDVQKAIDLPCGQCIGCRLERSRRWAVRLMHESQLHSANSFLTLTYSDSFLPSNLSLDIRHFQLFMKRLRRSSLRSLRFFHCGEYGETTGRPHYHVCLFGEDFRADRVLYKKTPVGNSLFTSERLSEVWGMGHALVGDLTFESAAYVARYCLKKVTGAAAEEHYRGRAREYVTMSRRPGIGAGWFEKYGREVYPSDSVVMRGKEMMPPPFYDKLLEASDPVLFRRVKKEREQGAAEASCAPDRSSRRLLDRCLVKEKLIDETLKRGL